MKKTILSLSLLLLAALIVLCPNNTKAEDTEDITEISATDAGVTVTEANSATEESTTSIVETGTLIEIGNTTAEETTIIIRTEEDGATVDQTLQIDAHTDIVSDNNAAADLSDWIAGDQITYTANQGNNSGELVSTKLRNRSFKQLHRGRNGWITEIRLDENEMDVTWANQIYTLNVADAKMVAGLKNPATLSDFQVGDRIRARVQDDGDGSQITWEAKIVVVLRRGPTLFMRVTRWVVPAEITSIPEDTLTYPFTITAKILPSKFYEEGDVNNLIGAPGIEFTIQVNKSTKLVRRYLGRATIDEFMEGDHIRVIGRLNDSTGYLDAGLIKNNSIQRLGVSRRISEVISVDTLSSTIIVKPIGKKNALTGKRQRLINQQNWKIQIYSETKLKKSGEDITLDDILVGDIIRARGVANRLQKTVAANAVAVVTGRFSKVLSLME